MINISSLANFLSMDAQEIDDISSITTENGNIITITLKKREYFCPNCLSPVKEAIKKRPRGKRGPYKKPGN